MREIDLDDWGMHPQNSGAQNRAAFSAAISALGPETSGRRSAGGRLILGPHIYDMRGDEALIHKNITLTGHGAGEGDPVTALLFWGTKGLRIRSTTDVGGSGGFSTLEGFAVLHTATPGGAPVVPSGPAGGQFFFPEWRELTVMAVNDIIVPAYMPNWKTSMDANSPPSYGWAWKVTAVTGDATTGLIQPTFRNEIPKCSVSGAKTFTVNTTTDELTTAGNHGWLANQKVRLTTTGAFPSVTGSPIVATNEYYVKTVAAADRVTLSSTAGGATIDFTSAGSGTHTIAALQSPNLSTIVETTGTGSITYTPILSHGIDTDADFRLVNVRTNFFPGNGRNIDCNVNYEQAPTYHYSNANRWKMYECGSSLCGGSGLFIVGQDANAGKTVGDDNTYNRQFGIGDFALLPNQHYAHHTDGNGVNYFSAVSKFDGPYAEGANGKAVLVGSASAFGGSNDGFSGCDIQANVPRISAVARNTPYLAGQWVNAPVDNGYAYMCTSPGTTDPAVAPTYPPGIHLNHYLGTPDPAKYVTDGTAVFTALGSSRVSTGVVMLGGNGFLDTPFTNRMDGHQFCAGGDTGTTGAYVFAASKSPTTGARLDGTNQWSMAWNESEKCWVFARQGAGGRRAHILMGNSHSYGRSGLQGFPYGVYIGANLYDTGPAAPIAGEGARTIGDYRRNSSPSVGQPKGWICTASGTPGTWESEGNL